MEKNQANACWQQKQFFVRHDRFNVVKLSCYVTGKEPLWSITLQNLPGQGVRGSGLDHSPSRQVGDELVREMRTPDHN